MITYNYRIRAATLKISPPKITIFTHRIEYSVNNIYNRQKFKLSKKKKMLPIKYTNKAASAS